MKHMKLGSKPDAFKSDGNNSRFVVSELPTDVIVHVGEVTFYLHKFPLLSKSSRLQRMVIKTNGESADGVVMHDIPGGPLAFEICAKFCYGTTVTLNAYNVVAVRCAAEYLEMTEDMEKGNLIYRIEVFLNSSIFRSWKDSIIVLKTTKALLPWSEELKLVGRCTDCIASKASVDPATVSWSYTCNKKLAASSEITETQQNICNVPKDWWIEDICELDVDLYKLVMLAVESKGRIPPGLICQALKVYAVRWLPDSYDSLIADDYTRRNRILVETIIQLLPSGKGSACSCRFLMKLLKVVILVGAGDQLKEELMCRISMQLHRASVNDLLIPAKSCSDTIYDLQLVQTLVSKFMMHVGSSHETSFNVKKANGYNDSTIDGSLLALGKLFDCYLAEIASDPNLSISKFIDMSKSIPEAARPVHDGLYTAIDIYLKDHPDLTKEERKQICGLTDVRKLSADACIHAAQNQRLPLRLVVQVLFYEQVRTATGSVPTPGKDTSHDSSQSSAKPEEDCDERAMEDQRSLSKQLGSLRMKDECKSSDDSKKNSADTGHDLLPTSKSRRIFDKLWASKGQGKANGRSDISVSSQSPTTSLKPVETKPPIVPSSRQRYFVS